MVFRRALRGLVALVVACLSMFVGAYDYNGTPVGHLIYSHPSATIKQFVSDGWRPTSISLEYSLAGLGFYRVAYVQNVGSHYQQVRYEGEISGSTINTIRSGGWRIEDIEVVGSKYSCIFVKNDVKPKSTLWFAGWTVSSIGSWLTDNPSWRLLEIDRYVLSGVERYSGIFILNTGYGYVSGWGWYPDAYSSTISGWAQTNKMRIIDVDRGSTGRYAAVLVARKPGERYYWYVGTSMDRLLELLGGLGLRAVTINARNVSGTLTYCTTAVNNTDAQSARVADLCQPTHNGVQGFYIRQLGSTTPIVNLNGTRAMHPSSTIKALIHYTGAYDTAASQLNTRTISGTPMVTWHQLMMYNSDNDAANLLMDTYTIDRLEDLAHNVLGMSATTQMRNRFGTGGPYGNDEITETTLSDLALLHTGIRNGSLGSTKTTWLRNNMNNETRSFPWSTVVSQTRTSLGISSTNYNSWASYVTSLNKAGNNDDPNGVTGYWSVAGSLTLPFRSSSLVVKRTYLFGHYVNRSTVHYDDGWTLTAELLREQIRASMQSFL